MNSTDNSPAEDMDSGVAVSIAELQRQNQVREVLQLTAPLTND